MSNKVKIFFAVWLCMFVMTAGAQEFKVASFRQLEMDLTARTYPMKDLNGDVCALIKVQMDKDFSISGPLGIVKREDKVAETWLYVPQGTKRLTISHPRWGMIRNYELPMELKKFATYEMKLEAIRQETAPVVLQEINTTDVAKEHTTTKKSKRAGGQWMVMASMGLSESCTYGLSAGVLFSKIGPYCSYRSHWRHPQADLTCRDDGALTNGAGTPYYQKDSNTKHYTALCGILFKVSPHFIVNAGAGYGEKSVYWTTVEKETVKNTGKSHKGMAAEVGLTGRWKNWCLAAGIETIRLKTLQPVVGVGYMFK